MVHEEGVGGYCARDATQFPQAIGLASTWDEDLITEVADVIRRQMAAVGARHTLSPVLDVARDARWGRVEETYGEDPYLSGRIGTAYVRGLQNVRPAQRRHLHWQALSGLCHVRGRDEHRTGPTRPSRAA